MASQRSTKAIWQVSAGPADRSYADQLLSYGVALIGPGDPGPWSSGRSDEEFDGWLVRHFAEELCIDDVLLLRTGQSTIRAVGLVASEYQFLPQFDDVNGWDLQHAPARALVAVVPTVRPRPLGFRGESASAFACPRPGHYRVCKSVYSISAEGVAKPRLAEPAGGGSGTESATKRVAGDRGSCP